MDKELRINIGSKQNQQNKEKENDFKWSTCEAIGSSIQILEDQNIVHKYKIPKSNNPTNDIHAA